MKIERTSAPTLLALAAIALWGTLAPLGVALQHVPPFLLTGLSLLMGSAIGVLLCGGRLRAWRVPLPTLALGVYGLAGGGFLSVGRGFEAGRCALHRGAVLPDTPAFYPCTAVAAL